MASSTSNILILLFLLSALSLSRTWALNSSSSSSSSSTTSQEFSYIKSAKPHHIQISALTHWNLLSKIYQMIAVQTTPTSYYIVFTLKTAINASKKISIVLSEAKDLKKIIEKQRGTIQDCTEHNQITVSSLQRSVSRINEAPLNEGKVADARVYLSTTLTNKIACLESLDSASGPLKPALLKSINDTYKHVVWQPYEAEFEDLPPWCIAGRAVWTATVPLVCFHLVEKHTPDRVVRQFRMIQEIPCNVDTDTVLHAIDLRGKRCEAVLGDMPPQHEYFDWYKRLTRRFINVLGARLIIMIEAYTRLLRRHPVGTEDHKDITDVLKAMQEIGRVQPPIPEAPNEEAATPSAAPTQSPSTSRASIGRGSRSPVATPRVVPTPDPHPSTPNPSPSPTIPSPIPHPSPSPTIPSPIPHPSPSPTTIPSPTPHPCPGSDIRPPTPRSFPELTPIPSFDLGLDPTPPDMHTQPPSHSTSTGPSSGIDPPHVHAEQPIGLPAEAAGRPKCISKAPSCRTGGHKHGHNAGPKASDEGHARPPPHYTRRPSVQPTITPAAPPPTVQTVDTSNVPVHQKSVIATLTRLFNETSEALGGSRANPAKKREIEDNSRKLGALFAKLNSGDISKNASDKLVQLCQALDGGDFSTALQIQVLLTTSEWDECNFWLATLKRMIKTRQNVRIN
ncbi:hypothetical protein CMV_012072 [Castanea mollissima]|uniref:Uncharacterized protein n=1 Tax=Castanea mollissima TaxID=60419 RepID=A0A8J4R2Q0_9ROSI|nr:hypothetical protein CMV_012072 [Castanea mollissima]